MILFFFTFLAGISTVLSPCILPVLPAILSGGIGKGKYRPLGIVLGLVVSFVFFTLCLTFLVHSFGISANHLRYAAIGIIALFGIIMIFPYLSDRFSQATTSVADFGVALQSHSSGSSNGFISGLVLGAALGLVWTPCAGPILASVITLVATQQVNLKIIFLTLTYGLGAGIPLLLVAYGGHKAVNTIPYFKRHSEGIKKTFGFLMLLTAVALSFNLEAYLQQIAVEYIPMIELEDNSIVTKELDKLRPGSPLPTREEGKRLPRLGDAPEIVGITKWINSQPLQIADLQGKVVLIDFWTYSCINCIRTLPYLKNWYQKYKDDGLVIIGVHTPEFEFEKDPNNVKKAVERFHILYPVALDSQYATWLAYNNRYWPAHYLIDQNGTLRQIHFGEGGYLETENAIRKLMGKAALQTLDINKVSSRVLTPETYLGGERAKSYTSAIHPKINEVVNYGYPSPLANDHIGLKGKWYVGTEKITSESDTSLLDLNFIASQVYLVMEAQTPQVITVFLDGQPLPEKYYTDDMDKEGRIIVHEPRKYDVVNLRQDYGQHLLTLKIPQGCSAYAFTFGDEN